MSCIVQKRIDRKFIEGTQDSLKVVVNLPSVEEKKTDIFTLLLQYFRYARVFSTAVRLFYYLNLPAHV